MSKQIELAVVVSDIHCGSVVGLAPPETKTDSGNTVGHGDNLCQAWLWQKWTEGIRQVAKYINGDTAALIVNGDATEGHHHRNEADLITATIESHTRIAAQCLKPLTDICKTRFVVAGTECHTKNMETVLADKINAEGRIAKDKWHLSIKGCEIDAAHHTGTTSRAYLEATAMSVNLGNARVNYARAGHPIPKVFLRAHRHCGGFYSDGDGLFAVTGAWQFLTRHGHKVVTDSIPRPSILILDWRNRPNGSLPIVNQITFNPPPHETKRF